MDVQSLYIHSSYVCTSAVVVKQIIVSYLCTIYKQILKGCNFHGFHGFHDELAICEIFILEISLANFDLHESESRILGDPRK